MNYLTNEEKMKLINEWMSNKTIPKIEKVEKKIEKKTRVSKK
jgi:hypothetical protein